VQIFSFLQAKWWAERWSNGLDSSVCDQALMVLGAHQRTCSKLQAERWAVRWSNGLDSRLNVWCQPKGELKGDPMSSHHACNRALADMPVSKLEAKWWAERWSSGLDSRLNVWCKPKGELKGDPMGWTSCMQQSTCKHACHWAASWKVSLKVIQWAWQHGQALMVWGGQQHTYSKLQTDRAERWSNLLDSSVIRLFWSEGL
jgi:hypothetical protein